MILFERKEIYHYLFKGLQERKDNNCFTSPCFLIYEYREQLEAERMIVFAPNSLFLDYISSVLPELGVGNISQTTFLDWALRTLDDSVKLKQTEEKLKEAFSINRDEKKVMLGKLKGTLEFKTFIEERLIQFENELVPTKDFEAWIERLFQ